MELIIDYENVVKSNLQQNIMRWDVYSSIQIQAHIRAQKNISEVEQCNNAFSPRAYWKYYVSVNSVQKSDFHLVLESYHFNDLTISS